MGLFTKNKAEHIDAVFIPKGYETLGFKPIERLNIGESIEGRLVSIDLIKNEKYKTQSNLYKIETSAGERVVNCGSGFDTLYGEDFRVGDDIFIFYRGKRRGSDKKYYHDFQVGVKHNDDSVQDNVPI